MPDAPKTFPLPDVQPVDLARLKVQPLAQRRHLTRAADILIPPDSPPKPVAPALAESIRLAAERVLDARRRGASVMLIYGAHLLRNGAALLLERLFARGLITHVATNGAGTIHDWEYAWCGASTESVEMNVASGTFGTWDETATAIHFALMGGALDGLGWGRSMGRFLCEDGVTLPAPDALRDAIARQPDHPLTGARADLLAAMQQTGRTGGRWTVAHPHRQASILAAAWRHGVPATVHPGIGYDIISNHPLFSGSVLGRAAEADFKLFGGSVAELQGGVVLNVGSAIMGPQVFEKSASVVNNLRLQSGRPALSDLSIFVVDLQEGGGWDWTAGEPPKTHPAYYLRFCKSYSRMGGQMRYLQCDNAAFVHHLHRELTRP